MPGELMVEEYKSLRKEIAQHAGSISRWHVVGFVSAGAALAVALFSGNWLIPAAALVILAGCIFGVMHDLTSIMRVAAYIQVFHEGKDTGALWETRLDNVRGVEIFVPMRPYMGPIPSMLWVGMLSALFVAFMSIFFPPTIERQYWSLLLPVIWLVFWRFMWDSYDEFTSGRFKDRTKQAFYDSLRRPSQDEPGLR